MSSSFNAWHPLHTIPVENDPNAPITALDTIDERFAACHFNRTCQRNFSLGNRKERACWPCPVKTDDPEETAVYLRLLDGTRAFYEHLGIREKPGRWPARTVQMQMVHFLVISTAFRNTRISGGYYVIENEEAHPLAANVLSIRLLVEFLRSPIGDS